MPYKHYSHEALAQAILAMRRNVLSRAAAVQYDVPRSTLSDGVDQKKKGTQTGQSRMLTDVEERALVTYLMPGYIVQYTGWPIGQVLPTDVRSPFIHTGNEGRDSGQGEKVDVNLTDY
ncbi:hypothetical protein MAR_021062 [Mya arenaria]|uniref:HTH psq-type domain-containing protein n=1 Tax=Mya arenaria TaxID=6604 RepID=A0ABY7EAC3_MYAAR|nr:hypothetical protein MAR_021062 [Mya arenaria]